MSEPSSLDADPTWMEIDLDAVRRNAAAIRRLAGPRRLVLAALKADAYGHGAVATARVLAGGGADYLGVGSLAEAGAIRDARISTPVLLLGNFLPETAPEIVRLGVIGSVDSRETAMALSAAAGEPAPVMIKVDCGFGRFGVSLPEAAQLIRFVAGHSRLRLDGLYTHLPFSDAAGRDWALRQLHAFEDLVGAVAGEGITPRFTQAIASPGLVVGFQDRLSAIAAGHCLFGLPPVDPALAPSLAKAQFQPALTSIRTKLVHVGQPLEGEGSHPYLRKQSGSVGVVPIGIHQGYRPRLGEAHMLIGGRMAPVLRVCLENTIIDLGNVGAVPVGTEVTVLGRDTERTITLEMLASWQAASPLSLLVSLGRSVRRRYAAPS